MKNLFFKFNARWMMAIIAILTIGVGQMWAYTPGSGYTKVTDPSSQLSEYDHVILYDEASGMAVTGSDGTDATLSSTAAAWTVFVVRNNSSSSVDLMVWSAAQATWVKANSSSSTYTFEFDDDALSGTTFTISNTGLLQYSGTRLAHYNNYIRFYSSDGNPLYVYKLNTKASPSSATNNGLTINPGTIYMSGKSDNGEEPYGTFYSLWIGYETVGHNGVGHKIEVVEGLDCPAEMWFNLYDAYDEYWDGNFNASSADDWGTFKVQCYAPEPGIFHATLKFTEYSGNTYVEVPIVITATAECANAPTVGATTATTPASLSNTHGLNISCAGLSSIGDCAITEYGFVYSKTVSEPTIGTSGCTKYKKGTSIEVSTAFTYNPTTVLDCGASYYVRAYAKNGAGTSYGAVTTGTTNPCLVDHFIDEVHSTTGYTGDGMAKEDNYSASIPTIADKTERSDGNCQERHYKFIGWVTAANKTNPEGHIEVLTGTATGTTYYAVWAQESSH